MSDATVNAARAAEAARVLAESLKGAEHLASVVVDLQNQLQHRAEDMVKMRADCQKAAVLARYVKDECVALRAKLLLAEAEVGRLTSELRSWKS